LTIPASPRYVMSFRRTVAGMLRPDGFAV
jgi:hypothetical protein